VTRYNFGPEGRKGADLLPFLPFTGREVELEFLHSAPRVANAKSLGVVIEKDVVRAELRRDRPEEYEILRKMLASR
jgi:hypothetical protein